MNIVHHRKYVVEFDSWEPTQQLVDEQMDRVVKFAKATLTHVGSLHISLVSEERTNV